MADDLAPEHIAMQEQDLDAFDDFLSANTAPPFKPNNEALATPLTSAQEISDLLGEPLMFQDRLYSETELPDPYAQMSSSPSHPIPTQNAALPDLPSISEDLRSAIRKTVDPVPRPRSTPPQVPPSLPDPTFHVEEAPPSRPYFPRPQPRQDEAPTPSTLDIPPSAEGGLRYSTGKRTPSKPNANTTPIQKPTPPRPNPAPKEKKASPNQSKMQELLKDFVHSEHENVAVLQRFLIRRSDKQFGPFREEEIFDMLNKHELDGNEDLAPLIPESPETLRWQPLYTWPSFSPLIQWLDQNPLRVAMPGTRSRSEGATNTVDPVSSSWGNIPAPTKTSFWRSIHPAVWTLASLLFFGSIFATFWVFRSASFRRSQRLRKPPLSITQRALQLDHIQAHRTLTQKAMQAYQQQKNPADWLAIRYAYLLFDSHGLERSMRADVEIIWRDLLKQKWSASLQEEFSLVELSRAVALRSQADLQRIYPTLRQSLKKRIQDPEWGYVIARMFELMGREKPALEIYRFLCQKQTAYVLPCWRQALYHIRHKQENQATAFLLQAKSRAPEHLPTLITLLRHAWKHGTPEWKARILQARQTLQQKTLQTRYPHALMARYHALEARYLWSENQADEALRALEKAHNLDPQNEPILQRRLRYAFWAGQPQRALDAIQNTYPQHTPEHAEILLLYFQLLRHFNLRKPWQQALRHLQKKGLSHPRNRYLTLYIQGQWFELQGKEQIALQAYRQALQERWRPQTPFAYPALLRLLLAQEEPDLGERNKYLDDFERDYPNHPAHLYWRALSLDPKKERPARLAIQKTLRTRFPRSPYGYELVALDTLRPPNERLAFLRQAYTLGDGRIRLIYPLIQTLLDQGNTKEALPYIKHALQTRPPAEHCKIFAMQALALANIGQCEDLPSPTQCPSHHLALAKGICLLRDAKAPQALPIFRRAEAQSDQTNVMRFGQALAYADTENFPKALRVLQSLLKKQPDLLPAWLLWLRIATDDKQRAALRAFHKRSTFPPKADLLHAWPFVLDILFQDAPASVKKINKWLDLPTPPTKQPKKTSPPTQPPRSTPFSLITPRIRGLLRALIATQQQPPSARAHFSALGRTYPRWEIPPLALSEIARRENNPPACRSPLVQLRQGAPPPSPSMQLLLASLYARCLPKPSE